MTVFLELKSRAVVATAHSATEYLVPVVEESAHSAKVAAPRVVETASLPDCLPDTLAISQILVWPSELECIGVAGKYLGVESELLLPSLDSSTLLSEALVPGVVDNNSDSGRWVVATKQVDMTEHKD